MMWLDRARKSLALRSERRKSLGRQRRRRLAERLVPQATPAEPRVLLSGVTAVDDSVVTQANATDVRIDVLANDTGESLWIDDYYAVTYADHGSIDVVSGNVAAGESDQVLLYTPDSGFSGTDTIYYEIYDDDYDYDYATVSVAVAVLPLSAVDDTAATLAGQSVRIDVLANDGGDLPSVDSYTLSATNGSVQVVSGNSSAGESSEVLLYTPDAGFTGNETFFYEVYDDENDYGIANVSVTVTAPPLNAVDDTATVAAGESVRIDVLANDTGQSLWIDDYYAVTFADHGSIQVVNGNVAAGESDQVLLYTPDSGFSGTDSIYYEVYDDDYDYDYATVSVAVTSPPLNAVDDTAAVAAGQSVRIDVLANDTGQSLWIDDYYAVTFADHGSIQVVNGNVAAGESDQVLLYTPDSGFSGTDSIYYEVYDDDYDYDYATVSVAVTSPPLNAVDDTAAVAAGQSVRIDVLANDGGDLPSIDSYTLSATNGSVQVVSGNSSAGESSEVLLYTPDAGFTGNETFFYEVYDDENDYGIANVSVTVTAPPLNAVDDTATVAAGESVRIDVLANDTGQSLWIDDYYAVTFADNGSIQVVNGNVAAGESDQVLLYTPDSGFSGTDSIYYEVYDDDYDYDYATVSVAVTSPPLNAVDDTAAVAAGQSVRIDVLANDTGQSLWIDDYYAVTYADHGSIDVVSGNVAAGESDQVLLYTPDSGFSGTDTIYYEIYDDDGYDYDYATVSVAVSVSSAPLNAVDDVATVVSGESVRIDVLANDTGWDEQSPANIDDYYLWASNGSVSLVDGDVSAGESHQVLLYTPNAGFVGTEDVSYDLYDSDWMDIDFANVAITVTAPVVEPEPFAANDDVATVVSGESVRIDVLANDTGWDEQSPANIDDYYLWASNGSVSLVDGDVSAGESHQVLLYTPNAGFVGTEDVSYDLYDSDWMDIDFANVAITVTAPVVEPEPFAANDDVATVVSGESVRIDVLANDTGWDEQSPANIDDYYLWASNGSVSLVDGDVSAGESHQVLLYTPNAGFVGTEDVSYDLYDSDWMDIDFANVAITVTAPVVEPEPFAANDDVATVVSGESVRIDVLANDTGESLWIDDYSYVTFADNGSIDVVSGNAAEGESDQVLLYTPNSGFSGTDTIYYEIYDNDGYDYDDATVSVAVTEFAVNDDSVTLIAGQDRAVVDVSANDVLLEPIAELGEAANGTVRVLENGRVEYRPDAGFSGTDNFTYSVVDTEGVSHQATVEVDVASQAAPVFTLDDQGLQQVTLADGFTPEAWTAYAGPSDSSVEYSTTEFIVQSTVNDEGEFVEVPPDTLTKTLTTDESGLWTYTETFVEGSDPFADLRADNGTYSGDDGTSTDDSGSQQAASSGDEEVADDPFSYVFVASALGGGGSTYSLVVSQDESYTSEDGSLTARSWVNLTTTSTTDSDGVVVSTDRFGSMGYTVKYFYTETYTIGGGDSSIDDGTSGDGTGDDGTGSDAPEDGSEDDSTEPDLPPPTESGTGTITQIYTAGSIYTISVDLITSRIYEDSSLTITESGTLSAPDSDGADSEGDGGVSSDDGTGTFSTTITDAYGYDYTLTSERGADNGWHLTGGTGSSHDSSTFFATSEYSGTFSDDVTGTYANGFTFDSGYSFNTESTLTAGRWVSTGTGSINDFSNVWSNFDAAGTYDYEIEGGTVNGTWTETEIFLSTSTLDFGFVLAANPAGDSEVPTGDSGEQVDAPDAPDTTDPDDTSGDDEKDSDEAWEMTLGTYASNTTLDSTSGFNGKGDYSRSSYQWGGADGGGDSGGSDGDSVSISGTLTEFGDFTSGFSDISSADFMAETYSSKQTVYGTEVSSLSYDGKGTLTRGTMTGDVIDNGSNTVDSGFNLTSTSSGAIPDEDAADTAAPTLSGGGHNTLISSGELSYDIDGTHSIGDMTGTQWAKDGTSSSSSFNSSYTIEDGEVSFDKLSLTSTSKAWAGVGHDVEGTITVDELSGDATDGAEDSWDVTSVVIITSPSDLEALDTEEESGDGNTADGNESGDPEDNAPENDDPLHDPLDNDGDDSESSSGGGTFLSTVNLKNSFYSTSDLTGTKTVESEYGTMTGEAHSNLNASSNLDYNVTQGTKDGSDYAGGTFTLTSSSLIDVGHDISGEATVNDETSSLTGDMSSTSKVFANGTSNLSLELDNSGQWQLGQDADGEEASPTSTSNFLISGSEDFDVDGTLTGGDWTGEISYGNGYEYSTSRNTTSTGSLTPGASVSTPTINASNSPDDTETGDTETGDTESGGTETDDTESSEEAESDPLSDALSQIEWSTTGDGNDFFSVRADSLYDGKASYSGPVFSGEQTQFSKSDVSFWQNIDYEWDESVTDTSTAEDDTSTEEASSDEDSTESTQSGGWKITSGQAGASVTSDNKSTTDGTGATTDGQVNLVLTETSDIGSSIQFATDSEFDADTGEWDTDSKLTTSANYDVGSTANGSGTYNSNGPLGTPIQVTRLINDSDTTNVFHSATYQSDSEDNSWEQTDGSETFTLISTNSDTTIGSGAASQGELSGLQSVNHSDVQTVNFSRTGIWVTDQLQYEGTGLVTSNQSQGSAYILGGDYDYDITGGEVNGTLFSDSTVSSGTDFRMNLDADEFTGEFDVTGGTITVNSSSVVASGGSGSGSYTVEGDSNGQGTVTESYDVSSDSSTFVEMTYMPPSDIAAPDSANPGGETQGTNNLGTWEITEGLLTSGYSASSNLGGTATGTWSKSSDGGYSGIAYDIDGTFTSTRTDNWSQESQSTSTYIGQDWIDGYTSKSDSFNETTRTFDTNEGTSTGQVGQIDVTGTITLGGNQTSSQETRRRYESYDGQTLVNTSFDQTISANASSESSDLSGGRTWDYDDGGIHYNGEETYSETFYENVDRSTTTTYQSDMGLGTETIAETWDNSNGSSIEYTIRNDTDQASEWESGGTARVHDSFSKATQVRNSSNDTASFGSKTTEQIGQGEITTTGTGSTLTTRTGTSSDIFSYDSRNRFTQISSGDFTEGHQWGSVSRIENYASTESLTTDYATGETSWGTDRDPEGQASPGEGDNLIVNHVTGSSHSSPWSQYNTESETGEIVVDTLETDAYDPAQYDTTVDYSGYYQDQEGGFWREEVLGSPSHEVPRVGYYAPGAQGSDGSLQALAASEANAAEANGEGIGSGSGVAQAALDQHGGQTGSAGQVAQDAQESAEENRVEVETEEGDDTEVTPPEEEVGDDDEASDVDTTYNGGDSGVIETVSSLFSAFGSAYVDYVNPWNQSNSVPVDGIDRFLEGGTKAGQVTAVVAGTLATGGALTGIGASTTITASSAAGFVATEIVDTAVESALTAVTGVPVIIPLSPIDLVQDGGKLLGRRALKESLSVAPKAGADGVDDFIIPGQKWYHGTDVDSADDIISSGLNRKKLLGSDPVEGGGTPGFFVTDRLEDASDYARIRSAEKGRPQPGSILEFDDADIGKFLEGVGKNNEAVIPFDVFDKIPRPRRR